VSKVIMEFLKLASGYPCIPMLEMCRPHRLHHILSNSLLGSDFTMMDLSLDTMAAEQVLVDTKFLRMHSKSHQAFKTRFGNVVLRLHLVVVTGMESFLTIALRRHTTRNTLNSSRRRWVNTERVDQNGP